MIILLLRSILPKQIFSALKLKARHADTSLNDAAEYDHEKVLSSLHARVTLQQQQELLQFTNANRKSIQDIGK